MSGEDFHRLIDAQEATRRLRVSLPTLYSYVSRGLIRSETGPGDARARLYALSDVEELVWRKTRARKPTAAAASALSWGLPVLETRLSEIKAGALTYRGQEVPDLAADRSLEEIAALLWQAEGDPFAGLRFDPATVPGWAGVAGLLPVDRPIDRAIALMPLVRLGPAEPEPFAEAARLVQAMAAAVVSAPLDFGLPLHAALAAAWGRPEAAEAIRRVLVCSADHELNASTFTVRVAASTDVDFATCLLTGLTTFCGFEHTGLIGRARRVLEEAGESDDLAALIHSRACPISPLPGFYHRLYPEGDPRARAILAALALPEAIAQLIREVEEGMGLKPNVELALVAVEAIFGLPSGAAEAMFATGRAVGWIAHAMEQRQSGVRIRPRAYTAGGARREDLA